MMDHAHVNKLGKKNAFSQSPRADRRAAAAKAGEGGMPRCYVAGMKEGRKEGGDRFERRKWERMDGWPWMAAQAAQRQLAATDTPRTSRRPYGKACLQSVEVESRVEWREGPREGPREALK